MTVYLDLVFALNFAVNYLLLRGTARLGASAAPRKRLLGGAALGAAYAVAVYLPDNLVGTEYYHYGSNKIEQAAKRYWEEIKK